MSRRLALAAVVVLLAPLALVALSRTPHGSTAPAAAPDRTAARPPSASPAGPEGPGAPPATAARVPGMKDEAQGAAGGEADVVPEGATSRWYEQLQRGQKVGWIHVVWEAIAREGQPSVRDTTTFSTRTARDMLGHVDVFEDRVVTVTERGLDGALYSMRATSTEAATTSGARTTVGTTTWGAGGYDLSSRIEGESQAPETHHVPAAAPAVVDAEAFLSRRIQTGALRVGEKFSVPVFSGRRGAVAHAVEVVGREDAEGEAGAVSCWKVKETDPETRSDTWLWMDGEGAIVRLKGEVAEVRRRTPAEARSTPAEPPSFSITCEQEPAVHRLFAADQASVDVTVAADPDRPDPEFPASPWSRVLSQEKSAGGTVFHVQMNAYDAREKTAKIPVTDPAFAKDLEPTVLMQVKDPRVVAAAKKAVGDATDAREAAKRIAEFVFQLRKESGEVNEASAVEILDSMQGDCSEHALLFVALCRAVGLPARRCSGFVCVGTAWGSHAWAEIWTGQWIGADPTTNDVGTSARYLFFGYQDDPESLGGVVASRAQGRLSFAVRSLVEGDETVDLGEGARVGTVDADARKASLPLIGLYAAGWPDGWSVRSLERGGGALRISGPKVRVFVSAQADQGYRDLSRFKDAFGESTVVGTFGGRPALLAISGDEREDRVAFVSHRRLHVRIDAELKGKDPDADWATIEKILAPTFADRSRVAR